MNTSDLTDVEVDGIDYSDAPEFTDAYISYAYSVRLDRPLTQGELDELNESRPDFVYECVVNYVW